MKYLIYIIALVAILLGISFFGGEKGPYTEPPIARLPNTNWVLAGIAEKGSDTEESVLALNLALSFGGDKEISGKICNSFSGTYSENGPSFKVPNLVSTKMACSGIVGEIEAKFFSALSGGVTYNFEEGGLLIITDSTLGRRFFFSFE